MPATTDLPTLLRDCESLARPLYAGLDGVQTFDRVDRVRDRLDRLRAGAECDQDLLALLAVFHGVVGRLGPLGPGGRFDLFLGGLGLTEDRRRRVRQGLARYVDDPRTLEERLLHDAVLLEEAGVPSAVGRLLAAGKKRVPPPRAVAALDPGPPAERFRTEAGRTWAESERAVTLRWIQELRDFFVR